MAGVSQIMRMQASNCCSRSNSSGERPALRPRQQRAAGAAIVLVAGTLLFRHRHEVVADLRPGSSLSTSALRRRSITGATRLRNSARFW